MDEGASEERTGAVSAEAAGEQTDDVITKPESSVETTRERERQRKEAEEREKEAQAQQESVQEAQQGDDRTPEEIREDIRRTRVELGDTAEQLAAKSDVKGQAKAKVDEVKGRVTGKKDEFQSKAQEATPASAQAQGQKALQVVKANPIPFAVGGAVLLGYVIGRSGR